MQATHTDMHGSFTVMLPGEGLHSKPEAPPSEHSETEAGVRAQSCYSWKCQTDGTMSFYDDRKKDDKLGKIADPIVRAVRWVQTRSPKEKGIMVAAAAVAVRPLCFQGPSGAAARRRRALAAHTNALGWEPLFSNLAGYCRRPDCRAAPLCAA